jgi:hypothetical protein
MAAFYAANRQAVNSLSSQELVAGLRELLEYHVVPAEAALAPEDLLRADGAQVALTTARRDPRGRGSGTITGLGLM